MINIDDTIGLVATWHKRSPANAQERALIAAGIPATRVIHLEDITQRDRLVSTAPVGRTIAITRAWLVADPRALRKPGGLRSEWNAWMRRAERRGVIIWDVESGIRTASPAGIIDLMDRVADGLTNAGKGRRSKGRPVASFAPEVVAEAKRVWRDQIEYPTWAAARAAMPAGFTVDRAYDEWGKRKSKSQRKK